MGRRRGVAYYEWDDANEEHLARHGVVPSEVEEIFLGRTFVQRGRHGRYIVFGRTAAGRYLFLVVARLPGGGVRAITARDMIPPERRIYLRRST